MNNWTKVFEAKEEYKVEIVKDILTDRGYEPVIINKKDTAYNIFGQYEVHVDPKYAVLALRVIENDIKFE
jgi:hypothetical protein